MQPLLSPSTPIDLTNCDREPIHIPGHTQAHGALIAVERASKTILQATDNFGAMTGNPGPLLGQSLADLFSPQDGALLAKMIDEGRVEQAPQIAFTGRVGGAGPFDVIVHTDGPLAIIEVEPLETNVAMPDYYGLASRAVVQLQSARSLVEYADRLAALVRNVCGYDRVMIYRFGEDWSGHVIAESMTEDKKLTPFLDMHYPASDIPAQARALFLRNTVRMLPDARYRPALLTPMNNPLTGQPLDLSCAFLRGASQMYTEYLENMGVRATLTLAISDHDRLWGLIACHHYDEPRRVSHGVRAACELLARVASLQIVDRVRSDEADYRSRIDRAHSAMIELLAARSSNAEALLAVPEALSRFVDCAGVAVYSAERTATWGRVPPPHHIARLVRAIAARGTSRAFFTDRLSTIYPDAAAIAGDAAGVLALPVFGARDAWVLFFRPEMQRTVKWGGDPHKPVSFGPMGDRLSPRKSFDLWLETVEGASAPWTPLERESAEALHAAMTALAAKRSEELERLNRELERRNEELDSFAYVASHDLKEPLRGIFNYTEMLLRDSAERLSDDEQRKLVTIQRLSNRTRQLIEGLFEYSRLGHIAVVDEEVSMRDAAESAVAALVGVIGERGAIVRIDPALPTGRTVRLFAEQVLVNLISNSIKYNRSDQPEVEVGFARAGEPHFPEAALGAPHAYLVRDNGIGIDPKFHDTIFRIFKRLHGRDQYGGGSGVGLTIVKRMIERVGGSVGLESTPGKGTTFWFTLQGREPIGG